MQQHDTHAEAARRDGSDQGQFPYGIDPRGYGLSKLDYQQALDHHRTMQHYDIKAEQHEDWRIEQERIKAETAYHEQRNLDRQWWLEPLKAFGSISGFCFWAVCWFYLIGSILLSISEWSAKRDAQWCLKDVAKCERIAKGETK